MNARHITFGQLIDIAEARMSAEPVRGSGDSSLGTAGAAQDTRNMREALALARNGYPKGTEQLAQCDSIHSGVDVAPSWGLDVRGLFPCMPAFFSDDPECMFAPTASETPQKLVHLLMPAGYSGMTEQSEVLAYGKALVTVVRALEAAGVSVAVSAIDVNVPSSHKDPRDFAAKCPFTVIALHSYGECLDLDRLAFTGSASFLRRLVWAMREQDARYPKESRSGNYGNSIWGYLTPEIAKALTDDGSTPVILPWLGRETNADYTATLKQFTDRIEKATAGA
jgi:hypothetical protein